MNLAKVQKDGLDLLDGAESVRSGLKPGITTVILTLNEEAHIARAIASANVFSREVLVVDSFSQDRTVAIAQALGARVVRNNWVNYARQFRFALEECEIATEWVLRLDADERIGTNLAEKLRYDLQMLPSAVTGVFFNRRQVFMGRWIRNGGRYPLALLRLWRNGVGEVEDRWMDEHVRLREGRSITLDGEFADECERDMSFFITKHNSYAAREAIDVLGRKYGFISHDEITSASSGVQAKVKRFLKEKLYNQLPFAAGPILYFIYRYIFRLGFLDGREGFIYHVMQGFWYRFLVDVRVLELERAMRGCTTTEARLAALRDATGLKL